MKMILCVLTVLFICSAQAQLNLPKEVTKAIATDDAEIGEWYVEFDTENVKVYRQDFDFSAKGLKKLYKEITGLLKINGLDFNTPETTVFEIGENTVDFKDIEAMHALLAKEDEDGDLSNYARIDWNKGKHAISASLWPYEYGIQVAIFKK